MAEPFLALQGLCIDTVGRQLVIDASLRVGAGQIVALVGASGSGKTLTARACLGLVEAQPGITAGELVLSDGQQELRPFSLPPRAQRRALDALRGTSVGWLPQEARASLDPLRRVAAQVQTVLALRQAEQRHTLRTPTAATDHPKSAAQWLSAAGFPDPKRVGRLYPHELSGGMAQRACIALALARGSRFLLADEPTTGLDPTVQASILDQLTQLAHDGCGVLLITHDLRILPGFADQVYVMDHGRIVEQLPADGLNDATAQPTRQLIAATRRIAGGRL